MPATFEFDESNGAGQTVTHGVTQVNWKATDDTVTAYTASPVATSTNSYDKWQNGHFSGTFNQISNLKFAHTAGVLGTGLTLMGPPTMTADGDRLTYTTPTRSTNAALTTDMTSVVAIESGVTVYVGPTSANASGKEASTTSNPCYTNYLTTQMQVASNADPGDSATVTLTLSWDES